MCMYTHICITFVWTVLAEPGRYRVCSVRQREGYTYIYMYRVRGEMCSYVLSVLCAECVFIKLNEGRHVNQYRSACCFYQASENVFEYANAPNREAIYYNYNNYNIYIYTYMYSCAYCLSDNFAFRPPFANVSVNSTAATLNTPAF